MHTVLKQITLICLGALILSCSSQPNPNNRELSSSVDRPNVVVFYVDDLGYGDLSSYGTSSVETPNVDKLAAGGIRFTDAHSPAATCTPSRYSMLTGRYAFRNNAAVLPGDAPLIIDPSAPTLPKLFKRAGYNTAVVGKWHLGLGLGDVDWNKQVKPGPNEIGFDYSFLLPSTGDRVPSVYVEDGKVLGLEDSDPLEVSYSSPIGSRPVGRNNPEVLRQPADDQHADSVINGISRIGFMAGGKSAEWVDEEFPDVFTDKAIDFIKRSKDTPFFLFFPFHDIHVPRLSNERFVRKSGMGPRGDAILQMDWMTGRIVDALKEQGLLDNTLIIFSSDNGPVLNDGYEDKAVELLGDHKPAGPYRGGKYSAYEAGTRVPMITYYPSKIQPGVSDALMTHTDFYASFAALLNIELDANEAPDSEDMSAALLDANQKGRRWLVEEAYSLALRFNQWKLISPYPNGPPAWIEQGKGIESGMLNEVQLFNLKDDPSEQNNLAEQVPALVQIMQAKLEEIKAGN